MGSGAAESAGACSRLADSDVGLRLGAGKSGSSAGGSSGRRRGARVRRKRVTLSSLRVTAACGPPAEGEDPAYHGIYRGLVERPGTRLALLPDRPARTIVLLVRLTASRST